MLAHEIIDAEKSQDLQSASWRAMGSDDVAPVCVLMPGNQ